MMMDFEAFESWTRVQADDAVDPAMSVASLELAVLRVAASIVEREGGGASLLARRPELLSIDVDTRRFGGRNLPIGDLLNELAVAALLAVMAPVVKVTMTDSFHEGFVAAAQKAMSFMYLAHPHAGGVIDEGLAARLDACVLGLAEGSVERKEFEELMEKAESVLRLLCNLDEASRIAKALGGPAEIRSHYDSVVKLNLVRRLDPEDFHKWMGEELSELRSAAATHP